MSALVSLMCERIDRLSALIGVSKEQCLGGKTIDLSFIQKEVDSIFTQFNQVGPQPELSNSLSILFKELEDFQNLIETQKDKLKIELQEMPTRSKGVTRYLKAKNLGVSL